MAIVLNGSSNTITPVSAVQPAGSIFQIINAVYSTAATFTTSGSTFQDTGLTAAITPSSSSNKILVIYALECAAPDGYRHGCRLVRGSTDILLGDAAGSRVRASNNQGNPPNTVRMTHFKNTYLDSPATTSATTYKLTGWSESNGAFYINRSANNTDGSGHARGVSTITLMEVAA